MEFIMSDATTITDPLVTAFGDMRAQLAIAITNARMNDESTVDLKRRQIQVSAAWDEFISLKHY